MGEAVGKDGEPPSANDASWPLIGWLCGLDNVCSTIISSPSELLSKLELPFIQGIGVKSGLACGLAEERSSGLEDADVTLPSMLVSAGPGLRA